MKSNKREGNAQKKAEEHNEMRIKFQTEKDFKTVAQFIIDKVKARNDTKKSKDQSLTIIN